MKKFLALFFALILALSSFTVAFADKANLTCDACKLKLADEKAYDAHVNGGCGVLFSTCEFCSGKVNKADKDAHLEVCPMKAACQYCAKDLRLTDVATHEAACTKNPAVQAPESGKDQYECDVCHAIFTDEAAYKTHVNSTCLEQYTECKYCAAKVKTTDVKDHEGACPKGAEACDYCGKTLATQNALAAHKDAKDCEKKCDKCGAKVKMIDKDTHKCAIDDQISVAIDNIDWEKVLNTVVETIKGIDWDGIFSTIEGLFGEVEKLLGDIDFESLLGEIEGFFSDLIPAEEK